MTKLEFIETLREKLFFLPKEDLEERISFYSEGIEDRIEDGFIEADAVSQMGEIDDIVKQIINETPLNKLVKDKAKPSRALRTWEIVLLILGFPLWFSLLLSAFAIILSLYVVLWSVIISLWAIFVSLIACALGGIVSGIYFMFSGNTLSGVVMHSASIICIGLSIFVFYGCKVATKGTIILTKKIVFCIKKCFIRKGEA